MFSLALLSLHQGFAFPWCFFLLKKFNQYYVKLKNYVMNIVKTSKIQDGVSLPEFTTYTLYLSGDEYRALYIPLMELLVESSCYDDEVARLNLLNRLKIPTRSKWVLTELLKAL